MSNGDMFGDEIPADALEHMLSPEMRAKWPEALANLVDVITAAHQRAGEDMDSARTRALITVRALSIYAGGRPLYLPKRGVLDRALRDREMWERYTGNNVDALADAYALTRVGVYKILGEQRALFRNRIQPMLFDENTLQNTAGRR